MNSDQEEGKGFLERLVAELKERLYILKTFDATSEINTYCDDLETEILTVIESAHEHLNKVQEHLLAKATEYRSELLKPEAILQSEDSARQVIDTLTKDVKEFSEKVLNRPRLRRLKRNREGVTITDNELEDSKQEAKNLIEQIKSLKARMRSDAFANKFMKMKKNDMFFLESEQVGTLEIYDSEYDERHIETSISIEQAEIAEVQTHGCIRKVIYLLNGNLAYITYAFFAVWDTKTKETLLACRSNLPIVALIELPNGYLASAGGGGSIFIWDVENCRLVKEVHAHDAAIFSLVVLRNGNVASSCSYENSLKIWKVDINCEFTHLLTITSYRHFSDSVQMLSNGYLVSECDSSLFQVWNPHDGRLVKTIPSKNMYFLFCVLSNDQLIWDSPEGIMTFHFDKEEPRLLFHDVSKITALAELPNGLIIAGLFKSDLQSSVLNIIDPRWGNLLQTLPGHGEEISSFSFSRDHRLMVTSADQPSLKIWSLKYDLKGMLNLIS